ncbi:MAG TPA: zf-HC2 domain-containing protein [Acidobacteriota bacterium]|jgi:anti-sigma factor RsiW|nr:zf-HC2 domain-containing protein [Acidobacteriota bacterium]
MKRNSHPNEEQWILYHYTELSAREQRAIEEHLKQCAECKRTLMIWKKFNRSVSVTVPEPSAAQWSFLREQVLEDFCRRRNAGLLEMLVESCVGGVRKVWNFLTEDPMAAVAYAGAATAYLVYSLLSISELQGFIPDADQVLSLIRLAF